MTKKLLKQAMVELLAHRSVEKITVKELCDRADVSRSTFYDRYEDIFCLLRDIEEEFISLIPADYSSDTVAATHMLELVSYVRRNESVYVALRKHSTSLEENLVELIRQRFRIYVGEVAENGFDEELLITYAVSGSCRILDKWISGGYPCSSKKITSLIMTLGLKIFSPVEKTALEK